MDTSHEKQAVPWIVHQTAPDDQQRWDPRWRHCHGAWKMACPEPEYRHMFWDDAGLRALVDEAFPEHLQTYDDYNEHIQRVDFARAAMLYIYGGLYADMDVEARSSPFPYLPAGVVSVVESPYPENEKHQNSMMASPPRHSFWQKLVQEAAHRRTKSNRDLFRTTWQLTGPQLLDAVVAQNAEDVHVLPCREFNPGMNSPFFNSDLVLTRHFCTSVWTHKMDSNAMLLYQSARCSSYEGVKLAASAGADLVCHDHAGLTPLHHAALRGDADMISLLVELRSQVDIGDTNNSTALHYAVQAQKINAVRALINVGASTSVQLQNGLHAGATPLHLAQFLYSQNPSKVANDIIASLRSSSSAPASCKMQESKPWWSKANSGTRGRDRKEEFAVCSSQTSYCTGQVEPASSSISASVALLKAELRSTRGRSYCCWSDWHERNLGAKSSSASESSSAIELGGLRASFTRCRRAWGRRSIRQWREIICVD